VEVHRHKRLAETKGETSKHNLPIISSLSLQIEAIVCVNLMKRRLAQNQPVRQSIPFRSIRLYVLKITITCSKKSDVI
jgi:hypothetical protein